MKIITPLPRNPIIAMSGGVDSMVLAGFIGRHFQFKAAFFNHGTHQDGEAEKFVIDFCQKNNVELFLGKIETEIVSNKESQWRDARYSFFNSLDGIVLTGHHLDDCVETYLWSMLHGNPKVIPYIRGNVVRPLLRCKKQEILEWAVRNNVEWFEDDSNQSLDHTRNYVRHELMPKALVVNPGLHKVVDRFVQKQLKPKGD
jgi:tRNA(Ile)-lysidine synthase